MSKRINVMIDNDTWVILARVPTGERSRAINEALRAWGSARTPAQSEYGGSRYINRVAESGSVIALSEWSRLSIRRRAAGADRHRERRGMTCVSQF